MHGHLIVKLHSLLVCVAFSSVCAEERNLLPTLCGVTPSQGSFISKELEQEHEADEGEVHSEEDELRSVKQLSLKITSETDIELKTVIHASMCTRCYVSSTTYIHNTPIHITHDINICDSSYINTPTRSDEVV